MKAVNDPWNQAAPQKRGRFMVEPRPCRVKDGLFVLSGLCEKQAAGELVEAAKLLAEEPNAIQLRYLQTLTEIAGDRNSTIVFPLDLVTKIKQSLS